jgi:hypothetical protein
MGKFDHDPLRRPETTEHRLADGRVVRITTMFGHLRVGGDRMARHTRTEASIDGTAVNPAEAAKLVADDQIGRSAGV